MTTTEDQVRRMARVLRGFMTEAESNGFASSFAIDPAAFVSGWRQQEQARASLPPQYVPARVEDLPRSMLPHVDAVRSNPAFAPAYGANAEIRLVELGRLVAFQHWMDTDVSHGVHGGGLDGPPSEQHILDACLPPTIVSPAKIFALPISNGVTVYSMNNTIRAVGPVFDFAKGEVKFVLSTNPNLMLVRVFEGRHILANGYHRAWWLRSKKVDMVPAVVVPATSVRDLVPEEGFMKPDLLMGDRPPIVDDFFSDSLAASVIVSATLRQVKVSAEVLTVPRVL